MCRYLLSSKPYIIQLPLFIQTHPLTPLLLCQSQWSPGCFLSAPGVPSLKAFALAGSFAWNSPPQDVCMACILMCCGSWLKCCFLSDALPVHPFQNDNFHTFITAALTGPLPLFYSSPWHLYHLFCILLVYHLFSQHNSSSRTSEGCDSLVDSTQGCLSRNSVNIC